MKSIEARLSERARIAAIALDEPLSGALVTYFELLQRWNAKINLTSLPDEDEAIDRLLLEPVAAGRHLRAGSRLIDLGSGGGSPAIPLALALGSPRLIMVESRGRKAAFLREAARVTSLSATVEDQRFEAVAESGAYAGEFDIVSMRAIRMDEGALTAAARFLAPDGKLALFVSPGTTPVLPNGHALERFSLLPDAELLVSSPVVPRGT